MKRRPRLRPASPRRWRRLTVAAVAVAALASSASATPTDNLLPDLPAKVGAVKVEVTDAQFPVMDAGGQRRGTRSWRLPRVGGNCCEVRPATSPDGRILEFGGTFLLESPDEGLTWREIRPDSLLLTGEGDVVAAPNGDIVGVGWDPYSGDHLQSFKWTAATKTWSYAESPVHAPFYDRPWLTIIPGPLTDPLGATVPYGVLLDGGHPLLKTLSSFISFDGLRYTQPTLPNVDTAVDGDTASLRVPVVREPAADHWTSAARAGTASLAGGGVVKRGQFQSPCAWMHMPAGSTTWQCHSTDYQPAVLRQDSEGRLVRAWTFASNALVLETSMDGGATWRAVRITSPDGYAFERANDGDPMSGFFDVAVNGRLGFAALSTRTARDGADDRKVPGQDVVYVVDTTGDFPVVRESMYVGIGGLETAGGLVPTRPGPRLDFMTVAILPSGRIVTGYLDSSSGSPRLAVETGIARTRGGRNVAAR